MDYGFGRLLTNSCYMGLFIRLKQLLSGRSIFIYQTTMVLLDPYQLDYF
ncbi:hypothetical protein DSUL_20459 [Desulfovibrionales bacterium]